MLGTPELESVLHGGLTRAEGEHPVPQAAGHTACGAAQEMLGFLGCGRTLKPSLKPREEGVPFFFFLFCFHQLTLGTKTVFSL